MLTLLNSGGSYKALCSDFATGIVFTFVPEVLALQLSFVGVPGSRTAFGKSEFVNKKFHVTEQVSAEKNELS